MGEQLTLTSKDIKSAVAEHYDMSVEDLLQFSRARSLVSARTASYRLCKELLDLPLTSIGRAHGGRDQTSVKHCLDRWDKFVEREPSLPSDYRRIKEALITFAETQKARFYRRSSLEFRSVRPHSQANLAAEVDAV